MWIPTAISIIKTKSVRAVKIAVITVTAVAAHKRARGLCVISLCTDRSARLHEALEQKKLCPQDQLQ